MVSLGNTAAGIEFQYTPDLNLKWLPGPKTPLEISSNGPSNGVTLTLSAETGTTKQSFCSSSGGCTVALRYKAGSAQHSIYLVRAGGKILVVSPDQFRKSGPYAALLRHASITSVQELGGASATPAQGERIIAQFQMNQ